MNALVHTVVAGGLLWLYGLATNGSRAARGNGAVFVWCVLWAFVVTLVVLAARRRQREHELGAEDTSASLIRRLAPLRDVALTVGITSFVLLVGVSKQAGDFGIRIRGELAPLALCALALPAVPLLMAPLAPCLRRTLRTAPPAQAEPPPPQAYALALLPMLTPALVMAWLRLAPVPQHLEGVIAGNGLAGILFLQLETLALPAALIVACGLDAADGSRGVVPYARWVVGTCVVALVVAAVVPVVVEPDGMHQPARLMDDHRAYDALPPLDLLRGAGWLMLGCSLCSAAILARMGRRHAD